jgi:hypothetical protein
MTAHLWVDGILSASKPLPFKVTEIDPEPKDIPEILPVLCVQD